MQAAYAYPASPTRAQRLASQARTARRCLLRAAVRGARPVLPATLALAATRHPWQLAQAYRVYLAAAQGATRRTWQPWPYCNVHTHAHAAMLCIAQGNRAAAVLCAAAV